MAVPGNNSLSRQAERRLEDWLKSRQEAITESRRTWQEWAIEAEQALGFRVTQWNVKNACVAMDIKKPHGAPATNPEHRHTKAGAARINIAIARTLVMIAKKVGSRYDHHLDEILELDGQE